MKVPRNSFKYGTLLHLDFEITFLSFSIVLVSWPQNPSSYCIPFAKDQNKIPIAPCGAVANSIFNGEHHS